MDFQRLILHSKRFHLCLKTHSTDKCLQRNSSSSVKQAREIFQGLAHKYLTHYYIQAARQSIIIFLIFRILFCFSARRVYFDQTGQKARDAAWKCDFRFPASFERARVQILLKTRRLVSAWINARQDVTKVKKKRCSKKNYIQN